MLTSPNNDVDDPKLVKLLQDTDEQTVSKSNTNNENLVKNKNEIYARRNEILANREAIEKNKEHIEKLIE